MAVSGLMAAFGRVRKEDKERLDHQPRQRVDGQWLTFPFPFVHHQPLGVNFCNLNEREQERERYKVDSKSERTGEDRRLPTVETRTRWLVVVFSSLEHFLSSSI